MKALAHRLAKLESVVTPDSDRDRRLLALLEARQRKNGHKGCPRRGLTGLTVVQILNLRRDELAAEARGERETMAAGGN